MAGFIVIDRKIKNWRWWHNGTARDLWLYMLLEANWKDGYWGAEGIPVKRGQFITSYSKLAKETGYDRRTVKRWTDAFAADGMCTCECTGKYMLITLINYCKYQDVPDRNVQVDAQVDVQDIVQDNVQDMVQDNVHNRTNNNHMNKNNHNNQDKYTVESKTVIDLLNRKTGKSFRYSESNLKHIRARFNEGAKMEDFETVIDRKYKQWHGTDMAKFLRPETLFGSKFDSYLNEGDEKTLTISDPGYYSGEGEW